MRLRNVFHAFALWALVQGAPAAAAHPPVNPSGVMDGDGRVVWGLDLVATVDYVTWTPPAPAPLAPAEPLDTESVELADEESYMDVYRILKEENSCSRFFGGPVRSVHAFNNFARQLRKKSLGPGGVAIRMSGAFVIYYDNRTGARFRLFEESYINTAGPFFLNVVPSGYRARMQVGRFPVPSKGARALTLLHELGHLVRGEGGGWLLPNDGGDRALSERNTREVEGRCLEQLLALGD
jgi:hypothetical protein